MPSVPPSPLEQAVVQRLPGGRKHCREAWNRGYGFQGWTMIIGLYAAATGLRAVTDRQDVLANNIANAATPGFRRQRVVDKGFYNLFMQKARRPIWFEMLRGPGGGLQTTETFSDFSSGGIRTTGNPLDLALQGPGFFAVETPQGERFTRNGTFTVDADGQLATPNGYKVLSEGGGTIDVQGGRIQFAMDGTVYINGAPVGKLRVVEFEDPHMLTREGFDLYRASDAALQRSAPGANTEVISESLELSNVSLPYELIQMTLGMRLYEANQRAITAIDETVTRLIQDVGTPQ